MNKSVQVLKVALETNDFEELCESAEGWDQQYYQMEPGSFEGGMDLTQVGSRQIMRERFERKIRYQGTAPLESYGFALPFYLSSHANWVGRPVRRDSIVTQVPGRAADLVSSNRWDTLTLSVSREEVHKIVSALTCWDGIKGYHNVTNLTPANAEALRRLGHAFLNLPAPETPEDEKSIARFSEQFVKLFLWELVKAQDIPNRDIGATKSATLVRQTTDYVLADPNSAIGLTDICEKFDVSLRTLNYVFHDMTGMSPATWLRRIRLNRVRKTLLNSSPEDVLVKQVAIDNGFLHFGHFSKQYRRFFGHLPSQTLQSS